MTAAQNITELLTSYKWPTTTITYRRANPSI